MKSHIVSDIDAKYPRTVAARCNEGCEFKLYNPQPEGWPVRVSTKDTITSSKNLTTNVGSDCRCYWEIKANITVTGTQKLGYCRPRTSTAHFVFPELGVSIDYPGMELSANVLNELKLIFEKNIS